MVLALLVPHAYPIKYDFSSGLENDYLIFEWYASRRSPHDLRCCGLRPSPSNTLSRSSRWRIIMDIALFTGWDLMLKLCRLAWRKNLALTVLLQPFALSWA